MTAAKPRCQQISYWAIKVVIWWICTAY